MALQLLEKRINDYQSEHMPDSEEMLGYGEGEKWIVESNYTFDPDKMTLELSVTSEHGKTPYSYKPSDYVDPWKINGMEVAPSPRSRVIVDYSIPFIKLTSTASTRFAAGYYPTYDGPKVFGHNSYIGRQYPPLKPVHMHGLDIDMNYKSQMRYLREQTFGRTIRYPRGRRDRRVITETGPSESGKHHTIPVHLYGFGTKEFQHGFDEELINGFMDEVLDGELQ